MLDCSMLATQSCCGAAQEVPQPRPYARPTAWLQLQARCSLVHARTSCSSTLLLNVARKCILCVDPGLASNIQRAVVWLASPQAERSGRTVPLCLWLASLEALLSTLSFYLLVRLKSCMTLLTRIASRPSLNATSLVCLSTQPTAVSAAEYIPE